MGKGIVRKHDNCGGQLYSVFFQSAIKGKIKSHRLEGIFGCSKCGKAVKLTQEDFE